MQCSTRAVSNDVNVPQTMVWHVLPKQGFNPIVSKMHKSCNRQIISHLPISNVGISIQLQRSQILMHTFRLRTNALTNESGHLPIRMSHVIIRFNGIFVNVLKGSHILTRGAVFDYNSHHEFVVLRPTRKFSDIGTAYFYPENLDVNFHP